MNGLLLVLCLLATGPAEARTLTQLISDSRALGNDPDTNGRARFSDTQITQFLNEGQRQAISLTWCLERSYQFALVAGTTYYDVPADFLGVRRVTRDWQLLDEMTPVALDGRSRGWNEAGGTPTYYTVVFSSGNKVAFAPYPAVSSDTGTIRMEYFAQPTDMSSGTDLPFASLYNFYSYHNALPYFAASRMAAIDRRDALSTMYLQQFAAYVDQMKTSCKRRDNYSPTMRSTP